MIMRIFIAIIDGIIGGFILGIALSSFIAIFSLSIFNYPFGIKYLPYYTAFICAIIIPLIEYRRTLKNNK